MMDKAQLENYLANWNKGIYKKKRWWMLGFQHRADREWGFALQKALIFQLIDIETQLYSSQYNLGNLQQELSVYTERLVLAVEEFHTK